MRYASCTGKGKGKVHAMDGCNGMQSRYQTEITKWKFLVSDKNMGLCLFIQQSIGNLNAILFEYFLLF